MATYSKETALYDTGAISSGIADAESNGKKEATNYIYAGSDGIKIANADPEHADTYQKQTAESTEFYVDGVKRSDVSSSGLDVFAEDGSTKNASFGATSFVGRKDDYNISIEPENFELNSGNNNGSATLFRVGASGNPTPEIYQKTEWIESKGQTVLEDAPISGSIITVKVLDIVGIQSTRTETLTFTEGVSATKSWSGGSVKYTAPRTFEYSGAAFEVNAIYSLQADAVDLGVLQFGSRQDGGIGNNSATIGNELVAPYSYQTVVGKHNAPADAPFIVGVGSPEENKNAFSVGWNGDIRSVSSVRPDKSILYNRTVVYDCKSRFRTESTDMVVKNAYVALCGRICQLVIIFTNTGSVASGGNFISGSFNGVVEDKTAPPLPRYTVNGASFYGNTAIVGNFTMGGTITIRNMSPTARTIGSSNSADMSFTYIVLDDFWTP